MLLAHLSDLHLVAHDASVQADALPRVNLLQALSTLEATGAQGVVITGDLANDARAEEYDALRATLAQVALPLWVVPGNHDDPDLLIEYLGDRLDLARNPDTGFCDKAVDLTGHTTLILLDSSRPGLVGGTLHAHQLDWLDQTLTNRSDRSFLVALHHPPFDTGVAHLDRVGLDAPGRAGLERTLSRHFVTRVLCGHTHRYVVGAFAGAVALSAPSTAYEFALDFARAETHVAAPAPSFLLHHLAHHAVASHRITVGDPTPVPYRR